MVSRRRPPTFMPATPWSQPPMTMPWPSWKVNGSPRSQLASNWEPVDQEWPTYCMVQRLPDTASGPSPSVRSSMTRSAGGGPSGMVICGFSMWSTQPQSRSHAGDELVHAVVDGAERVLAQDGPLRLVVELQVHPVHREVPALLLRL